MGRRQSPAGREQALCDEQLNGDHIEIDCSYFDPFVFEFQHLLFHLSIFTNDGRAIAFDAPQWLIFRQDRSCGPVRGGTNEEELDKTDDVPGCRWL